MNRNFEKVLNEKRMEYVEISAVYQGVEAKWRRAAFVIALALGSFPVISGVASMMPELLGNWMQLFISFCQVCIVVMNLKLEIGERVADSGAARKGYAKLATDLEDFLCRAKLCEDEDQLQALRAQMDTMMVQVRAIVDHINAQMTYPESQTRSDNMEKRTSVFHMPMGSIPSMPTSNLPSMPMGKADLLDHAAAAADGPFRGQRSKDSPAAAVGHLQDQAREQADMEAVISRVSSTDTESRPKKKKGKAKAPPPQAPPPPLASAIRE